MGDRGKNRKSTLTAEDELHHVTLSVDSSEEVDMVKWLNEAASLGLISDFTYQPPSWTLSEAVKIKLADGKDRTLYREHSYTADFIVEFSPGKQIELAKELRVPYEALSCESYPVFIDVKGTFNKQQRSFSTDRKWMWQKFKVYICEIIPQKFFKLFGCPEKSRLTEKTKKPRSCYLGFKSIAQAFGLSN